MAAGNVIRLAVVGWGPMAEHHARAFRTLGAEIVASCNRSQPGRDRARAQGVPAVFASISEMIATARPDALLVTTSVHANFAAAMEALESGLPILLEKPPGASVAELDALTEKARARGALVMVALNRLHYSVVRKALDEMGGRAAISSVSVEWSEDPIHLAKRGFTDEQIAIRSCTNSVHGLTLVSDLVGALRTRDVFVTRLGERHRLHMLACGEGETGVPWSFVSSWDAPVPWRMQITTRGCCYRFQPLETCTVFARGDEPRVIHPDADDVEHKPGLLAQARTFLSVVRTGRVDPRLTFSACRPALELGERLRSPE